MLSIKQARRQALWLAVWGWVVGIVSVALLSVALLKGIYGLHESSIASPLTASMRRLVASLYFAAHSWSPSLSQWLWGLAPDLDLSVSLFTQTNWGVLFFYLLLLLSTIARGRALRIRQALAEHEERMQQIFWEEEVRSKIRNGASLGDVQQNVDIRITLDNQPTPWHQGLLGVVILGIALPLAVDAIKAYFGWLK